MSTLEEVLDQQVNEVELPKPLPLGTYLAIVDGPVQLAKIGQNQTDCANVNCKILQPVEVDPDALAQVEGGVSGKTFTHRLFLTEDAKWRFDQFAIDHLGIDKGLSRKAMIAQMPGRQFIVTMRHRPSQQGDRMFNEVAATAHA